MSTNIKPPADLLDLSKLSESSLRKYLSYFRITTTDENMKAKISQHFHNEFKADTSEVIDKFLELKKQQKDKQLFRIFFQEKTKKSQSPSLIVYLLVLNQICALVKFIKRIEKIIFNDIFKPQNFRCHETVHRVFFSYSNNANLTAKLLSFSNTFPKLFIRLKQFLIKLKL